MEFIMNMAMFFVLVFGIILVTRKMMIKSIRTMAVYLKWNNNIIGQVLGYATSTPELLSAFVAGSIGMISTSIYNVISSNIVNVLLVVFVAIYFKRINSFNNKKFVIAYSFTFVSILLPILFLLLGIAQHVYTIPLLLILYVAFVLSSKRIDYFEDEKMEIKQEKQSTGKQEKKVKKVKLRQDRKNKVIRAMFVLLLSIVLLYFCSNWLGMVLENLGKTFNVPEIVIGILLGIVTSLPELMTFIGSFKKFKNTNKLKLDKASVEVVNNLVTSNISNFAIIQTVAILVYFFVSK